MCQGKLNAALPNSDRHAVGSPEERLGGYAPILTLFSYVHHIKPSSLFTYFNLVCQASGPVNPGHSR